MRHLPPSIAAPPSFFILGRTRGSSPDVFQISRRSTSDKSAGARNKLLRVKTFLIFARVHLSLNLRGPSPVNVPFFPQDFRIHFSHLLYLPLTRFFDVFSAPPFAVVFRPASQCLSLSFPEDRRTKNLAERALSSIISGSSAGESSLGCTTRGESGVLRNPQFSKNNRDSSRFPAEQTVTRRSSSQSIYLHSSNKFLLFTTTGCEEPQSFRS